MTLTEAQTQFNALADRLSAAKAAQEAALASLGRTPTDVWDTYPDELRAVTGGTGNYQESKTVTADPAGMTILPDEGYSGMLKAIIAAEPNFQPWNLVDGIEAWGITGTAKPAVSTDPPTNLPVDKDDADTAYEEQTGAAPVETDYFVCADNNGNITYWYLSESFEITSYNPINTDFAAKGAVRMAYHTTGENAGQWTFDDFTNEASAGENYLKNIRYCTREKLYYNDVEIWPKGQHFWSYNGVELPVLPKWDKTKYPYASIHEQYGKYSLIVSDVPQIVNIVEGYAYWSSYSANAKSRSFSLNGSVWTGGDTEYTHKVGANSGILGEDGFVWANHDLYLYEWVSNKGTLGTPLNTVFLAASVPVPV